MLVGFIMVFASIITYLGLLLSTAVWAFYVGNVAATIIGICGVITVGFQVRQGMKKIMENLK